MSTLKVNNIADLGDDPVVTAGVVAGGALPAGSILQVVQGTFATQTTTTSGTYQNTGLTVSITPSSATSKVYVIGIVTTRITRTGATSSGQGACAIDRNSGTIVSETTLVYGASTSGTRTLEGPITLSAIDSPATSSAVTYTWQHKVISSDSIVSFQGNLTGFLIAMEVAG